MRRPSAMAASLLALAAALLLSADVCAGAAYKVGGLDAWGVPPSSEPDVYWQWPKSIHFRLGDSLYFLYPPSQDSVVQVTAKAYAACDVSAPLAKLADGSSLFNLTKPGRAYFTSAAPGHCKKGQKVTVDVPKADGSLVPPTSDDQAALAPPPPPGPAEAPVSMEALAPSGGSSSDDHASAAALRAVAGAGSVVAAAAALSFAFLL